MKGLLLKDWYMIWKSNKAQLLLITVFTFLSSFTMKDGLMGAVMYCGFFSGILTNTTYSLDERWHFLSYYDAMPGSRSLYVAEKYILTLLIDLFTLLLNILLLAVHMTIDGNIDFSIFPVLLTLNTASCLIPHSLIMPFVFLLGAEKGRIWYIIIIFILCSSASSLFFLQSHDTASLHLPALPSPLLCLALVAAVYGISWALSTVFYKRRQL